MSEELIKAVGADKNEMYETLLPQLAALMDGETDLTANLANLSAALHETFGWWWVGFYWVRNDELVLAPFQGPIACTRIKFGKGVCGTVWKDAMTMHTTSVLVPDVNKYPGHIACSSSSVAEIVVPIFNKQNQVIGVLDIDSEKFDVLDKTDVFYLEKLSQLITENLSV